MKKLNRISAMWKYQETAPLPDPSPDWRQEEMRGGSFLVDAACVRGKKHIHGGSSCDDSFALCRELDGAVLLTAVSDGAGSRKFSRVGSRVSCEAAVESMAAGFRWLAEQHPAYLEALQAGRAGGEEEKALRNILTNAMLCAQNAIYDAFKKRIGGREYAELKDVRDLSATLLLAALIPSESGEHTVASCQVGDGVIATLDTGAPYERALTILGVPDSGEYAGETEFLTSVPMKVEKMERRTVVRRARLDTVFVMSDGVADDYFPANPELFRLYFDLAANGILPLRTCGGAKSGISVPEPLCFPPVRPEGEGASAEAYPVNYTWLIMDALRLTLADLWKDPAPLWEALRLLPDTGGRADRGKQLLRWLEHYAEAASFDDRTLVVMQTGKEGGAHGQEKPLEGGETALEYPESDRIFQP